MCVGCSLGTVKEAALSRGGGWTATQPVLWELTSPFRVRSNYSKEARALHSHIDQSLGTGFLQKRGIILGRVSFFQQVQLPKRDWAEPSATNSPTAGRQCWIWVRREQPSIHDSQVSCPSARLWGQGCRQLKWGRRRGWCIWEKAEVVLNWFKPLFNKHLRDVPRGPDWHPSGKPWNRKHSWQAPVKRDWRWKGRRTKPEELPI